MASFVPKLFFRFLEENYIPKCLTLRDLGGRLDFY